MEKKLTVILRLEAFKLAYNTHTMQALGLTELRHTKRIIHGE